MHYLYINLIFPTYKGGILCKCSDLFGYCIITFSIEIALKGLKSYSIHKYISSEYFRQAIPLKRRSAVLLSLIHDIQKKIVTERRQIFYVIEINICYPNLFKKWICKIRQIWFLLIDQVHVAFPTVPLTYY